MLYLKILKIFRIMEESSPQQKVLSLAKQVLQDNILGSCLQTVHVNYGTISGGYLHYWMAGAADGSAAFGFLPSLHVIVTASPTCTLVFHLYAFNGRLVEVATTELTQLNQSDSVPFLTAMSNGNIRLCPGAGEFSSEAWKDTDPAR